MAWKAKFIPQLWVNDTAMDVEACGDTTWGIDDEIVSLARRSANRGADWDFLRDDDNAPRWIQEWPGPFEVELVRPDGTSITAFEMAGADT